MPRFTKNTFKSIYSDNGFTLIELMIVSAILAALAAIAIPSYLHFVDRAKLISSVSAMTTVKVEMEAYKNDHDDYPTSIDFTNFTDQSGGSILLTVHWTGIKEKVYSWDSYVMAPNSYTLVAKAINSEHTVLTLTEQGLTY